MRKFLSLTFILLSLAVPALAQEKPLTIKNIRFLAVYAGRSPATKIVQVDEFSTDIHLADDVIHIKVIPSEVFWDLTDESITLGVITGVTEKKRGAKYLVTIAFDLTDGDVTYPCVFKTSGVFQFLHKASNTELMYKRESEAQEIKLISDRSANGGTFVIIPIQATMRVVNTERATPQTRKSTRSVSNRENQQR